MATEENLRLVERFYAAFSEGFHTWARQALGPVGLLLGWTPLLRAKVRAQAAAKLAAYSAAPQ